MSTKRIFHPEYPIGEPKFHEALNFLIEICNWRTQRHRCDYWFFRKAWKNPYFQCPLCKIKWRFDGDWEYQIFFDFYDQPQTGKRKRDVDIIGHKGKDNILWFIYFDDFFYFNLRTIPEEFRTTIDERSGKEFLEEMVAFADKQNDAKGSVLFRLFPDVLLNRFYEDGGSKYE